MLVGFNNDTVASKTSLSQYLMYASMTISSRLHMYTILESTNN